jgi:hypothetical protein
MANPVLTIGVVVGSFLAVVCFAFVINLMVRAKQRGRLIQGIAFGYIRKEESRFSGVIKRIKITPKRPSPQEIFDLQDYYDSKEPTRWEREIIEYTFKTMQLLGFEVKLYRTKDDIKREVDLSKRVIKPAKEVKKEMKRAAKERDSEGDEENLN